MEFLRLRRSRSAIAFRLERLLAAAQELRLADIETYRWVLAQASDGAEALAQRDPDAYVALFLAAAEDCGYGPATSRIANGLVASADRHRRGRIRRAKERLGKTMLRR